MSDRHQSVEGHALTLNGCRFGWVNSSYVYGLEIVNAHMRRALGTLTPYPTFVNAIEQINQRSLAELSLT